FFAGAPEMSGRVVALLLSLMATALPFPYSLYAQETAASPPDLNSILDSLERTQEQNPALSQPYEVTREYKVFRGDDPTPASVVTAQIGFTPPDTKTFQIIKAEGSRRGKKIVTAVIEQEIAATQKGYRSDISRANYNFVFVREEKFGAVPAYVLHMVPKRKEKGLLLGDIWVDAKSYHIRQIARPRLTQQRARFFGYKRNYLGYCRAFLGSVRRIGGGG